MVARLALSKRNRLKGKRDVTPHEILKAGYTELLLRLVVVDFSGLPNQANEASLIRRELKRREQTNTGLTFLSDHDWQVVRSRWFRGIDWNVEKIGRNKWTLIGQLGSGLKPFRTKTAAYNAGSELIRAESLRRR